MESTVNNKEAAKEAKRPQFCVQPNFYEQASALRAEFDEKLSASMQGSAGITPLTYVFLQDKYHFLTASGEQLFSHAILDDFIERLCAWSRESLGTFHVSTPQARVYIHGCARELVRDSINAQWHYVLSLTPDRLRSSTLKILTEDGQSRSRVGVAQVIKSKLMFNQLVVHNVMDAYGVDFPGRSMDPLQGTVFLDGYLW